MRIFLVDYNRLVNMLLPMELRTSVHVIWLRVMLSPVVFLYMLFGRNRQANLYALSITPQVCYLEKMLNDRFDFGDRRIYIDDPVRNDAFYLYQEAESKPVDFYMEIEALPLITYTDGEAGLVMEDFIVYVPEGLVFNMEEMKALLDMYKLAGKKYKIETF